MVLVRQFVRGALLEPSLGHLLKAVVEATNKTDSFKSNLNAIKSILRDIIPIIAKMEALNKELDRPKVETTALKENIDKGKEMIVTKCSKVSWWQFHKKIYYKSKLVKFEKKLKDSFQIVMQAQQTRDIKETLLEVKDLGMDIRRLIMNENIGGGGYNEPVDFQFMGSSALPGAPPEYTVGLDVPLKELKMELFKAGSSVIVLTALGGCGKTTLAKMLCGDEEVKGKYKNNILFANVSKTPNLKVIVRRLFHQCGKKEPEFLNNENAINHLGQLLSHIATNPILLVLDDVWSGSESLIEKFSKFQLSDFKIFVTSRFVFPGFGSRHCLKTLNDEDAMTLFRHFAFLQDRSSDIPNDLVKQIVKGCKGFPLALKVVGSLLCGKAPTIWQNKVMEWAEGVSILESNVELRDFLKGNLDALDGKVKECYMDLGSFPEDQRIPATALVDMWVELHNLNENGLHAIANLHELSYWNLLNLIVTRKDASEVDGFYNEHFVMQHDILRELVIYLNQSSSEHIEQRKRLFIDTSGNNFPSWWLEQKPQHISARLLSISTDETLSSWCDMQPPEVEVLVLNFRTEEYTLPEFMEKMDKLKVLIVTNYGFLPAELNNFPLLGSLSNLKRLRLEHVSIPSLSMTTLKLRKMRKISLVKCNIGQAFSNCAIKISDALPNLVDIEIGYCNDLVELPDGLCDILPLKKLSITNCNNLSALPNDIGRLENLEVLRLSSCTELLELPDTIGSLSKLSFLDISECFRISRLPSEIGELHSLRKLCMRDCKSCELPLSIRNLEDLEEVRCDEQTALLWEPFRLVLGNLRIEMPKEDFNLNWLYNH